MTLNDNNLTVKLEERLRRIEKHKKKILNPQNRQLALGNTLTELEPATRENHPGSF